MAAKLYQKYQFIKLQNKTGQNQDVLYGNGDTVTIQPNAERRISTVGLDQMPNNRVFKFIEPTVEQMIKDGVLEPKELETEKKAAKADPKPVDPPKGEVKK